MKIRKPGSRRAIAADVDSASPKQARLRQERDLFVAYTHALREGRRPSREQIRGAERWEAAVEEKRRWEYYATIPAKHWKKMSGRQDKVRNEQAVRYGIPFNGATIDLREVVRALHDFLDANSRTLAAARNGIGDGRSSDPLLVGANSPALERYRDEQWKLARIKRMELEGSLTPVEEVKRHLGRLAEMLRSADELLQRNFGDEPAAVLAETLGAFEQYLAEELGSDEQASETPAAARGD